MVTTVRSHTQLFQISYFFILLSIPTLGLIKLSFLLFYQRVLVVNKTLRNISYLMLRTSELIVVLWTIAYVFAFIFACKGNFSAWWESVTTLVAKCVRTLDLQHSLAVSDFVLDVLIIVIPLPMVSCHYCQSGP